MLASDWLLDTDCRLPVVEVEVVVVALGVAASRGFSRRRRMGTQKGFMEYRRGFSMGRRQSWTLCRPGFLLVGPPPSSPASSASDVSAVLLLSCCEGFKLASPEVETADSEF